MQWLNACIFSCITFCFQLEDAAFESFEKAVKGDNIPLAFDVFEDLQNLDKYLKTWRVWNGTLASCQCFEELIHIQRPSPLEKTRA
jgi:hypothetical protein